jgi:hypothetical protein
LGITFLAIERMLKENSKTKTSHMKYSKTIPFFLAGMVIYHLAFTQTKLGISGGATAANFDYGENIGNPDYANEEKIGFNGGIKLNVELGKQKLFYITPELFINQNGTKDEYYTSFSTLVDSLAQNRVSLDYVGLYLPFKINLQSKKGAGVYFMGSGYADYAIAARLNSNVAEGEKVEFESEKDKIDFGYRLCIGLMFEESVGLEIGYNKGIKNIEFSTQVTNSNTKYLINNRGLTISLIALF